MLLLALFAAPAAAQRRLPEPRYWDYTTTPYFYYSSIDGWWLAGFYRYYSPIGYRDQPEPYHAAIQLSGGLSTEGSYQIELDAQAPAQWEGWRLGLTLFAGRANRLGYFGLGNATVYEKDSVTAPNPYFYAVSRSSQLLRFNVQRRITGPLRVTAGVLLEHTTYRELPGATVFARDAAAGTIDAGTYRNAAFRGGLVLDTRNNELDPHRGLYVEALYGTSQGYNRATISAQGYVSPAERLTFAGRLAGERMAGDPGVSILQTLEAVGRPYLALGGYRSLRGYYDSRFIGQGKLLGGLEARYALIYAPSLIELKLVGFWDAGRVFGPGESFRLTTEGLHHSGGGELMARLGRNTVLVFGAGVGAEGWQSVFGTTWSY